MENNEKRKALVIATIVCVSLLVGILGSYAFFISTGGNNKPEELSVQTGNMVLVFEDGNAGINEALNFGSSIIKTFTIENTGSIDATAKMSFDKLTNTYTYGSLTFTLEYSETEDGTYQEILSNRNIFTSKEPTTQVLANNLSIPAGEKYYYKLTITLNYLEDVDQTEDLNAMLSTNFTLSEGSHNVIEKIKTSSHPASEQPDFSNVPNMDEGIYQTEDNYGISYYYRGYSANNYIKFAGFYWRIVRINGDDSLRLIYDGTKPHETRKIDEDRLALTNIEWNKTYNNDAKYIGFMYGGENGKASFSYEEATMNTTSSNAKIELEKWYEEHIENKGFSNYIADEIFCNDRTIHSGSGFGTNTVYYKAYERVMRNKTPNNICPNKNDAFTVKDIKEGNASLKYPIGLLTVDEDAFAGGVWYKGNGSFAHRGFYCWSMTPFGSSTSGAGIAQIHSINGIEYAFVNEKLGLAPVINLSIETAESLIGTGTMTDPYRLESEQL